MKYWAYISYSHADERVVRKLHRRLESFRVPGPLRGKTIAGLTAGQRLRPVFRDRDELASAGDLRRSLDTALAESGALIVVCSPAAANSRWVNEEIRAFIALRGTARVFPLIIDGEPNCGDARECFPPALKQAGMEPIAGDLRAHGDGPRDGVLKIISGLLETGFDSIKQRETQRRNRQALGIAGLAGMVAIATSIMAFYALDQRDIARLRREQAEDLITFMLGDLRTRLTEVGRLDILDAVGDKAERYFAALPPSQIDDQTLKNQALALRQIGEVRLDQGQHEQAQQSFHASLVQLAELHRRQPNDPGVLFELAQAQFWAGASHYRALEIEPTRNLFEAYSESAGRLVALAPDEPDYRIEQAYAISNLGTLALEQRDLDAALTAFRQSGSIFADLAAQDPDNPDLGFELAANESWLAAVHEASYDWSLAVRARREAARLHRQVTETTGHPFHRRIESEAWSKLARTELALGRLDEAGQAMGRAHELIEALAAQDPDNLEWRINGLETELRLQLIGSRQAAGVLDSTAAMQTLVLMDELVAANPENRHWAASTSSVSLDLARWAWLNEQSIIAERLIAEIGAAVAEDFEQAADDAYTLALYLEHAALAGLDSADPHDAPAAQTAWQLIRSRPELEDEYRHQIAVLAGLLGHADDYTRLRREIDQAGYREPWTLAVLERVRPQ